MNAPFLPRPRSLRFGIVRDVDWNDTVQLTQTTLQFGEPVTQALDLTNSFQTFVLEQGAGVKPIALGTASGEILIADQEQAWIQIFVPAARVASWRLGTWPFLWRLFRPGEVRQIASGTVLISER